MSDPLPITEAAIDKKLEYLRENNSMDLKHKENIVIRLKAESEKLSYEKGILWSGAYLMGIYDLQNKNKEIVDTGNQLKKITRNKRKDPTGIISDIYHKISLALMYIGLTNESKKEAEMAIRFAQTIENENVKNFRLTQSYMDLYSHYKISNNRAQKKTDRDSLKYYLYQSLEAAEKIKDDNDQINSRSKYNEIIYIYMDLGIFYLEYSDKKGNIALAEKNLLTAEDIQNSKKSLNKREEAVLLNQLSWLYMEKKDYHQSIQYANRALKLQKQDSRPTARVESYEFLATCYMEIGEKEKSKFYMQQYGRLKDSLNEASKNNADVTLKKIIKAVDDNHKESSKKQWIITGALALIAGLVTTILWRRKNKALRSKYEQMMLKLKHVDETLSEETIGDGDTEYDEDQLVNSNRNNIAADTEERILRRLQAFEQSEKFLKKDLTVASLATQLNTNTKYLSEIIKNKGAQNFNTYINSLRINYIVHKLYNDPRYREYKISYLAEKCGYASSQVFVIAFKKINGLTPSYFIQNLKDDQVNTILLEYTVS